MARPQHPHPSDRTLLMACWFVFTMLGTIFVLLVTGIGAALPKVVRHGLGGTWITLSLLTPLLAVTAVVRRREVSALLPACLSLLVAGAGFVAFWTLWMRSIS